jgi:dinuclear metal center YbgI/SA1388 family protein
MLRDKILHFLNHYLNIENFEDSCVNGLQIEGKREIKKIVVGVSANLDLIRAAIRQKADMLIVHHGIFWGKSLFALKGIYKERVKALLKHDINLVAYHLPLDAHPIVGNNIMILRKLGLKMDKPFDVGYIGHFDREVSFKDFVKYVNKVLSTDSYEIQGGKKMIKTVAVVSGGSSKELDKAIEQGVDVFIAGDIKEFVPATCREAKINFINAWHHNTEKFGVQELARLIEKKFKVPTNFVNIENEV